MNKLPKTIARKLSFTGTAVVLVILSFFIVLSIRNTKQTSVELSEQIVPSAMAVNKLYTEVFNSKLLIKSWVFVDKNEGTPDKLKLEEIHKTIYPTIKNELQELSKAWEPNEKAALDSSLIEIDALFEKQASFIMQKLSNVSAYQDVLIMTEVQRLVADGSDLMTLHNKIIVKLESVDSTFQLKAKSKAADMSDSLLHLIILIIILCCCIFALLLGLLQFKKKKIAQSIDRVLLEVCRLRDSITDGNLNARIDDTLIDTAFRPIITKYNETLNAVVLPLQSTAVYLESISKGVMPQIITEQYNGDFNVIKVNLNNCITSINALIDETVQLTNGASNGDISSRANSSKHQGDFKKILEGLNDTMDAFSTPLYISAAFIEQIAKGQMPEMIGYDYKGDMKVFKENMDTCVAGLQGLLEVEKILKQLERNDYTKKIEGKYQGVYAEVALATNGVIDRLRTIQNTFTNISAGDFSDLATYKEIGKQSDNDHIIPNIISTIETIQSIVNVLDDYITYFAMGQIESIHFDETGFKGVYKNIIGGLNKSASMIVAPLQETSDVMSSIANGDSSKRVDGICFGIFDTLKESANKIVDSDNELVHKTKLIASGD